MASNSLYYSTKFQVLFFIKALLFLCIVSDCLFSYFDVFFVPMRHYFHGLVVVLLFIITLQKGLKIQNAPLSIIDFSFLILSVYYVCSFFVNPAQELILSYLRALLIPYMIFRAVRYASSVNREFVLEFCQVFAIVVSISAMVGFLQCFDYGFAWELRAAFPLAEEDVDSYVGKGLEIRSKAYGLAYNPVSLGYQISAAFPLCFYFAKINFAKNRLSLSLFYVSCCLLLFLLAYSANLRSAQLALFSQVSVLLGLIFLLNARSKEKFMSRFMVFVLVQFLGLFVCAVFILYSIKLDELPSIRFGLFKVALAYIFDHPLGSFASWNDFSKFKINYLDTVDYGEHEKAEILRTAPHNSFLNGAILYGWTGLFLIVGIYIRFISRLVRRLKVFGKMREDKELLIFMSAAILGLIANSMFHNAGLFVGGYLDVYFFGLAAGLFYLSDPSRKYVQ